MDLDRV